MTSTGYFRKTISSARVPSLLSPAVPATYFTYSIIAYFCLMHLTIVAWMYSYIAITTTLSAPSSCFKVRTLMRHAIGHISTRAANARSCCPKWPGQR